MKEKENSGNKTTYQSYDYEWLNCFLYSVQARIDILAEVIISRREGPISGNRYSIGGGRRPEGIKSQLL